MRVPDQVRQLKNEHTRCGIQVNNIINQLESELSRMKEKNLSQILIDSKDKQIETIVSYYNTSEEIIEALRILVLNLYAELRISDQLLMSTSKNRELLIDAILKFKLMKFNEQDSKV